MISQQATAPQRQNPTMAEGEKRQSESEATMEFRSYPDDAWYSVVVRAEGECLRVRYCGFPDAHDNLFAPYDFPELKKLDDFASRFRPVSLQLQDSDCSHVPNGLLVCASHNFNQDDLRFYDALVEGVDRAKHSFKNGEEECTCIFILSWLHGPIAGNFTAENIGQICSVEFNEEIDPIVASFIRAAREKILMASCNSNRTPNGEVAKGNAPRLKIGQKLSFSHHLMQGTRSIIWSSRASTSSKWTIGCPSERTEQDRDFGGIDDYYLIVVDNLEKDLTPSAMMEFISKEVSVSSQAFILPSLSSQFFTRGNILLDSKKDFEKLCDFLESSDFVIVSSRGRPWMITEKMSVHDTLRVSIETFSRISQKIFERTKKIVSGSGLKVVRRGTDEYRLAKQLSDVFKEFSDHQQKLQKRLIVEEGNIWQKYNADRVRS